MYRPPSPTKGLTLRSYQCSHKATVATANSLSNILKPGQKPVCTDCGCPGPNLWICLYRNCYRIGCSERSNDHSTLHNAENPTHCIHMNLLTKRLWCYECNTEVFFPLEMQRAILGSSECDPDRHSHLVNSNPPMIDDDDVTDDEDQEEDPMDTTITNPKTLYNDNTNNNNNNNNTLTYYGGGGNNTGTARSRDSGNYSSGGGGGSLQRSTSSSVASCGNSAPAAAAAAMTSNNSSTTTTLACGNNNSLQGGVPQGVFAFENKSVGLNVGMSGDSSENNSDNEDSSSAADYGNNSAGGQSPDEDHNSPGGHHHGNNNNGRHRPVGLVGLQNIGNTCYMNAALQALSNAEPLTRFFLDCPGTVHALSEGKKPGLSRTYQTLMREMWKKNGGYVTPSGILYGIRSVHPMFRGYYQHDTQEFLRNFMDQLHEELKHPVIPSHTEHYYHNNNINSNQSSSSSSSLVQQQSKMSSRDSSSCTSPAVSSYNSLTGGGSGPTAIAAAEDESGAVLSSSYDSSDEEGEEYETCDSGVSERSSLSDDVNAMDTNNRNTTNATTTVINNNTNSKNTNNNKRRLSSRSSSPSSGNGTTTTTGSNQQQSTNSSSRRYRMRLNNSTTMVIDSQPGTSSSVNNQNTSKKQQPQPQQNQPSQPPQQQQQQQQQLFRSIISDIFDGKLLSSVQCLTCDRVSSRIETFQDLSLPIPSKDHLVVLHGRAAASSSPAVNNNSSGTGGAASASGGSCSSSQGSTSGSSPTSSPPASCSEAVMLPVNEGGWVTWLLTWLRSWFYGPTITLHDCLAAFFSTDELKGDNMYSCEKCNKLRNGIKFSKVLQLPEILCIHLKRFRHELMFSSKISAAVSFPMQGLDMRPYLHKDCSSKITTYDLFSVICHYGTAGGGHYICYALNGNQWYEFDDQYVTRVTPEKVQSCEAYVLFYRKDTHKMDDFRYKIHKLAKMYSSMEHYSSSNTTTSNDNMANEWAYISKQWISRFNTCAEPGPIDNSDFLCRHGAICPDKRHLIDQLALPIPRPVYEQLWREFGGCAPLSRSTLCSECQRLNHRLMFEMETFARLNREAQDADEADVPLTHLISTEWYSQWYKFVHKKQPDPPGPIDNTKIKLTSEHELNETSAEIPECIWNFFYNIYGGGPEIRIRQQQQQQHESQRNINDDDVVGDLPAAPRASDEIMQRTDSESSLPDHNETDSLINKGNELSRTKPQNITTNNNNVQNYCAAGEPMEVDQQQQQNHIESEDDTLSTGAFVNGYYHHHHLADDEIQNGGPNHENFNSSRNQVGGDLVAQSRGKIAPVNKERNGKFSPLVNGSSSSNSSLTTNNKSVSPKTPNNNSSTSNNNADNDVMSSDCDDLGAPTNNGSPASIKMSKRHRRRRKAVVSGV